jgi:pimeloyl-ACP methyl ester carboxylesterase
MTQLTNGYITMDDDVRLFYQKLGSGPEVVVILNGFSLLDDFKYLESGRTIIALDLRHRGRSDFISDSSKLKRGIHQDVDDLESVRRHFAIDQMRLLAHSYAGMIVILYAVKYPSHVRRIVQIGSIPPDHAKQYPAHLMNADATLQEFFAKIQELEKERSSMDPVTHCKKFWSFLRLIYVYDAADADKLRWENCDLPTELNLMSYWLGHLFPSIQTVKLTKEDLARVEMPVLIVHGRHDRSAPYGGARDWALQLPNARLVTVKDAAHAPWIEASDVYGSVEIFLDGAWPDTAETLDSLDPLAEP